MTTSPSEPPYDVAVVGAGPAGLAAATTACAAGRRVVLVDAGRRAGGQYWRRPEDGVDRPQVQHDLATFHSLRAAATRARASGRLTCLSGHEVWTAGRDGEHLVLHALAGAVDGEPTERAVRAGRLVLAPGAYDRQVPFPGWELPGVLTAGGAQALLKGHGVAPGRRVVVAGTGPFLLPVAAGLAGAGCEVSVHEAGDLTGWLTAPGAVARNPGKLAEGASYLAALARHRVRLHPRSTVVAAHGTGQVEAVTLARLDRHGHLVPGSERRERADAVAVGWGFTPRLELALALGCATRVDVDGSLVVRVDRRQRSSVADVLAAGEACGVGGAALAVVEGALAGLAAADAVEDRRERHLRRRRDRLRAFAAAMHRAHPVPPGWADRLEPDTLVCRCEEVSVRRLREAVDRFGATDARSAKLLTRTGMGWCQGRVCGYASACLTAHWTGGSYDPSGTAERPVAVPVPLCTLAEGAD